MVDPFGTRQQNMSNSSYCTWLCCYTGKASAKITGPKPLETSNNSTASVLRFLWFIETDPSFSKRSLKMISCHYKLNGHIFHGDDLSYYYQFDYDTSKQVGSS